MSLQSVFFLGGGGTKIIFCNKSFSFMRMRLRNWVANFQKMEFIPGVQLGTGEHNREILNRKKTIGQVLLPRKRGGGGVNVRARGF